MTPTPSHKISPRSPRRVLLGVTGSIAAYKAPEIVRRLQDDGCEVRVIVTHAARQIVGPALFEALTGTRCMGEFWDIGGGRSGREGEGRESDSEKIEIEHISWGDWADCLIIAPATADCLAKMRLGIADTPLLATVLAARCPIIVAPAMNCHMWGSVPIQEHVAVLRERGVIFVGPTEGSLACGWEGSGRLAEVDALVGAIREVGTPQTLAGHHIVVALGPTRERIDPVRYISNRSSGKMGCAIIEAAKARGALVTAVHGPLSVPLPYGLNRAIEIESAREMADALDTVIWHSSPAVSAVVMAAAVADYRPAVVLSEKQKRGGDDGGTRSLVLEQNPDIIANLSRRRGGVRSPLLVGFAVETTPHGAELINEFQRKRRAKGVDLLVGNRGDDAFDRDSTIAYLVGEEDTQSRRVEGTKRAVSGVIMERLAEMLCLK